MKAILIHRDKRVLSDGSIQEIVIWKLPEDADEAPHGFKYRLYFGLADATCLVRYDNEKGKGDHRHLGNCEEPYAFVNPATLFKDFFADVRKAREGKL